MLSAFFIFNLCVILSGGESDCSYTWEIISDRENFDLIYEQYREPHNKPIEVTDGFIVYSEKIIKVRDVKFIPHEYQHAKCNLDSNDLIEVNLCHQQVDKEIWWP